MEEEEEEEEEAEEEDEEKILPPCRRAGQYSSPCPLCGRVVLLKTLRYSHRCGRSFDAAARARAVCACRSCSAQTSGYRTLHRRCDATRTGSRTLRRQCDAKRTGSRTLRRQCVAPRTDDGTPPSTRAGTDGERHQQELRGPSKFLGLERRGATRSRRRRRHRAAVGSLAEHVALQRGESARGGAYHDEKATDVTMPSHGKVWAHSPDAVCQSFAV